MKQARDLDPLNVLFSTYLGTLYYLDRQFDAAALELHHALELNPNFPEAHGMLFRVYLDGGKLAEARKELERIQSPRDLNEAALLTHEGRVPAALAILAEFEQTSKRAYVGPLKFACTYAAAGDKSRALDQLERAYEERDGMLAFIKTWPSLDPLRSEPRFKAMLSKLGL